MAVNLCIQVSSFRAFREEARIHVRPLTLLYGRNQAGKSSFLRLAAALGDCVFGAVPVIDLNSPAFGATDFKDLGFRGEQPSYSPDLRLENVDTHAYLELGLSIIGEQPIPNRIRLGMAGRGPEGADNPKLDVHFEELLPAVSGAFIARYRGRSLGQDWTGELRFCGMFPDPAPLEPRLQDCLAEVLSALGPFERIQWLAATRPMPSVPASGPARKARCCLPDGADLAAVLATRPELVAAVTAWLGRIDGLGETVSVRPRPGGGYDLALTRRGGATLSLSMAGEGLRWLLPISICTEWAASRAGDAPTMLAIEEPEAHLHPQLQLPLVERLLGLAASGIPCILETHSVHVLRRVQLAVASAEVPATSVSLHWFEQEGPACRVQQIEVHDDGTLEGWRPEVFEEEQALNRQIFEARWRSRGTR